MLKAAWNYFGSYSCIMKYNKRMRHRASESLYPISQMSRITTCSNACEIHCPIVIEGEARAKNRIDMCQKIAEKDSLELPS